MSPPTVPVTPALPSRRVPLDTTSWEKLFAPVRMTVDVLPPLRVTAPDPDTPPERVSVRLLATVQFWAAVTVSGAVTDRSRVAAVRSMPPPPRLKPLPPIETDPVGLV